MNYDYITILKLIAATLLPPLLSVILYILEKKTKFGKIKNTYLQIITGTLFGCVAILSTCFGIPLDGAVLNVRNAAPLAAGLIFGPISGIIAGVIGGIYRFIATYWGAGEFSQLACSIGCILSGLFAAGCRKFMFDNKKPSWIYGLLIGGTTEVLHMLLVFIFKMDNIYEAFTIVKICTLPMIICNAVSVMLSLLFVSIIGKPKTKIVKENKIIIRKMFKNKQISQVFQMFLMICIVCAFIATFVFTDILQTKIAFSNVDNLLELNIDDVDKDIRKASDDNLLKIAHSVATKVSLNSTQNELINLLDEYNISEINIIDSNGIIIESTSNYVGYDMSTGEQSKEFLCLLNEKSEYVQPYQPISTDNTIYRKYAGIAFSSGGFVQIGYNALQFQDNLTNEIHNTVINRHIGKEGGIIVCNEQGKIIYDNGGHTGESIYTFDDTNKIKTKPGVRFLANIGSTESYCLFIVTEGFYLIANIPVSEAMFSKEISVTILAFMEIIVFAALFIHVYFLVKKQIVDNIHKINTSLSQITNGNLNVQIDVRENKEFASLSDDINATVDTLKRYISEAESRIDCELEFARQIQHSQLPSIFPPYPDRKDIDIYALMDAAKEVGGDFYDFWITESQNLAFLVADVSGKGIPAALFMMRSKTLIKNLAESGLSIEEVFNQANKELCENNDAELFVTAWMGIIDIEKETLQFVNAGHNPPLIRHKNGKFEYLRIKPNFVLAGMEMTKYKMHEIQFEKGDEIFVYTDGVTEATNLNNQLYGEDRLKNILSSSPGCPKKICKIVRDDIKKFVNGAEQSDDITMLCVKLSQEDKDELTIVPNKDSIENVLNFTLNILNKYKIQSKLANKINIIIDEIYSNIVYYSEATLSILTLINEDDQFKICFLDNGKPFDPTKTKEPNISLSSDEREPGGLGIFMVKKLASEIDYKNKNNKNLLTIILKK